jgi:predicted RNase H-like nuclease (RuvC/YqgF family)
MSDADLQRDIGRMETEITNLREDVSEMKADVKALRASFSELKGGTRTLLGVASVVGALVSWGVHWLLGKVHP